MKKRILKIAVALVLVMATVLCFASCGNTAAKVDDAKSASGSFDGITWSYDEKTYTLTVGGSGAINFASADKAAWSAVRHSVKTVKFSGDGITEIGDYAFYYMPALTEVDIPDTVTRLGKYAFAFCSSLKSISGQLPVGLLSIGEGCFESCIAFEAVSVPSTVKSIGARAFAHCAALKTVDVSASLSKIEKWTFKGCSKIESLTMFEGNKGIEVDAQAFEGASKSFGDVVFNKSQDGKVTVTVKYVYENGSEAKTDHVEEFVKNARYDIGSPTIDGYTADKAVVSGYATEDVTVTVTYKENAVEQAPETEPADTTPETEAEKPKSKLGSIIAIVIMAIIILGIVGLVIFMVVSDKKKAGNNSAKPANKNNSKKRR